MVSEGAGEDAEPSGSCSVVVKKENVEPPLDPVEGSNEVWIKIEKCDPDEEFPSSSQEHPDDLDDLAASNYGPPESDDEEVLPTDIPCEVQVSEANVKKSRKGQKKNNKNTELYDGMSFECGGCMLSFSIKSDILQHQRATPACSKAQYIFRCTHCGKIFPTITLLKSHLRSHTTGQPHACDTCGKKFKHKASALKHCVRAYNHVCEHCKKAFPYRQALEIHIRIHTGDKPFECSFCGRKFTHKNTMKRHIVAKHAKPKKLDCDLCGKHFLKESRLKYHMRMHWPDNKPFKCNHCHKAYSHKQRIEDHYKKKHPFVEYIAPATDAEIANKRWQEHMGKDGLIIPDKEEPFANPDQNAEGQVARPELVTVTSKDSDSDSDSDEDDSCDRIGDSILTFTDRPTLERHKMEQGGSCLSSTHRFRCEHCGKLFKRRYGLTSHRLVHYDDKPHPCPICGRKFKHKHSAQSHCTRVKKSFPCAVCGKSFQSLCSLEMHNRIHTGVRPYQCAICERKFTHKYNMTKHVVKVHSKLKKLDCDLCGKKFRIESRLKYHMRVHWSDNRPFKCQHCHKCYSHKQNIERHYKKKHPTQRYIAPATDAELAQKAWDASFMPPRDVIVPDKDDDASENFGKLPISGEFIVPRYDVEQVMCPSECSSSDSSSDDDNET